MADRTGAQTLRNEAAGGTVVGKLVAGRYRIEAVVDEGGESVLYSARHEALGKRVALKMLSAGTGRSKEDAAHFLARAKLAASLTGPHVNRISDFGQSPEGSYVVMDWLEGQPLSAILANEESFPLEEVLDIMAQVGRAVAAAHARGVVHGKIDARQLFRVRQGEEEVIKVLGFGEPADTEGQRVRADVRALGDLLLVMASRARFDGVTTFAVRRQREPELDTSVGQKVRKLPAALQAVVVKALESTKGYRRVEDLCGDLERFGAGEIPDALLEMIASGSWALIPEEKTAVQAVERAAARLDDAKTGAAVARVEKPKPRAPAARPPQRAKPKVSHRQTALVGALIVGGLAGGWIVSGWMAPSDEPVISAENTRIAPRDFRSFGPDE